MKNTKRFNRVLTCSLAASLLLGLGLTKSNNINATLAESEEQISLGSFDDASHTFKYATADSASTTYRSATIYLTKEMKSSDNIKVPVIDGYSANKSNQYSISVSLSSDKTAKQIMEEFVRQVEFNCNEPQTIRIDLMQSAPDRQYVFSSTNNHYYTFVDFNDKEGQTDSWFHAYERAKGMTFNGMTGYLATITSLQEDLFVFKASQNKVGWLGGTSIIPASIGEGLYNTYEYYDMDKFEETHLDHWEWACGPEKGMMFFDVRQSDSHSSVDYDRNIQNAYINWDCILYHEPNSGSIEDAVTTAMQGYGYSTRNILSQNYSWNDFSAMTYIERGQSKNYDYEPVGMLVEFGDQSIGNSSSETIISGTGYTKGLYNITNLSSEEDSSINHGYIDVLPQAMEGEDVVINIRPDNGYFLRSLTYNDGSDHDITTSRAFKMPAGNVSVKANFVKLPHAINYFDKDGEPFSGTMTGQPTSYIEGEELELVEATKTGFFFDGWHLKADCSDAAISSISAAYTPKTESINLYCNWKTEDFVKSISMKQNPNKVTYKLGQDFSAKGGVITVHFASGKTEDVTLTNDMVSGYDKNTLGEQELTVTYQGKTTTLTITVKKASSSNGGAIAGLVIGLLILLLLIAFLVLYILWKLKDFKPLKFLIKPFRAINNLLYRTKLNNIEKKDAKEKGLSDQEYLDQLNKK